MFQDTAELLFFLHVISLTLFIFALMANLEHSGVSWFQDDDKMGNLLVKLIGLAVIAIDFYSWTVLSSILQESFGVPRSDSLNQTSALFVTVQFLYFLYIYHFYNHYLDRKQKK